MSNLLPQKQIHKNRILTWVRMYAVVCLAVGSVLFIGTAILLPSFFFVDVAYDAVKREEVALEKRANLNSSKTTSRLRVLRDIVKIFEHTPTQRIGDAILVVEAILDTNTEVNVSAYVYSFSEKDTSFGTMRVSGFADTRESLVMFVDELKKESLFDDAIIPVANLASGGEFTVVVRGKF